MQPHLPNSPGNTVGRILEIGDRALLKRVWPAETTLFWTGRMPDPLPGVPVKLLTWRALREVWRDLHAGRYNLVVCHPPEKKPWVDHPGKRRDVRHWLYYLLLRRRHWHGRTPLIVIDTSDLAVIPDHTLALLRTARLYFKRELALDDQLMLPPRANARARAWLAAHRDKLRPIALGLEAGRVARLPAEPVAKTSDLFFCGQVHTPLRHAEYPVVQTLATQALRVDIPSARLDPVEFNRRCAAAWLVWSPEGRGWDCFRHYEAAGCRSVAVINRPTIRCLQPLEDGVHCFYYDPARAELVDVIRRALADKDRLLRMGEAARAHVLRHHTHAAMCAYVLDETRCATERVSS